MNAMGPEGRHVNFARDPLHSYFHDPQKNKIYFLNEMILPPKCVIWYIYISSVIS